MRKKSRFFILFVLVFFILSANASADQIELQNGRSLRGEVQNNSIQIKTDYAELKIQSRYLSKITGENGIFTASASENNRFSGELLTEIIFSAGGNESRFSAAEIKNINFSSSDSFSDNKQLSVTLKNGDFFFASTVKDSVSINTSLGSSVNISYDNINSIEYLSGENIYLVKRKNNSELKSDLSGQKIIVWPAAAEIVELDYTYIKKINFN